MTREELKVGQIICDEQDNCYLVYRINNSKNSATCLDNRFNITSLGLDFLHYFYVDDEIDMDSSGKKDITKVIIKDMLMEWLICKKSWY